jgi:uncharacterized protein YndB with AHSA1/START domain
MHVERGIVLPCPPEESWRFLTEWERQGDWMADVGRITVTSPAREGVGVRLRCPTTVLGVPAFTEEMEVTVWEPPRRLVIRHGEPVEGRGTWRLTAAAGGTAFTWTEDVRLAVPIVPPVLSRVLGEVAATLYRPFMRWLMGRSLLAARRSLIASGPVVSEAHERFDPFDPLEASARASVREERGSPGRPG